MTINELRKQYKPYKIKDNEHNSFTYYDYDDGNGPVAIVVNVCPGYGKTVMQVVRIKDGKELLPEGRCRPCDDLGDAVDVAGEMLAEERCKE